MEAMDFDTAKLTCENEGAELTSIYSEGEQEFHTSK